MSLHKFRVGQYNVLANCLADNLKPWFWYGYAGIREGVKYRDDLDADLRLKVFGYGRSQVLIQFWVMMKRFFKVFHTDFKYVLHLQTYPDDAPSALAIQLLQRAMVDFFHRNNKSSPEGNKDLPYHLFDVHTPECDLWHLVGGHLGLCVPEDCWATLETHRRIIEASTDVDAKCHAIDNFNATLRQALITEADDEEFANRLHRLARFVCPSDSDLRSIFEVQRDWEWGRRSAQLVWELRSHNVDLWGVEELDEVARFRKDLLGTDSDHPEAPHYQLAVFKLRAIFPKEDGAGIFYNAKTFQLKTTAEGDPMVGCVRFSGAAALRGLTAPLRRIQLPCRAGIISCENPRPGSRGPVDSFGAGEEDPIEYSVPQYVFTDRLKPNDKDFFDERVAVFAVLQHRPSGLDVIVAATHLHHTQNATLYEDIRGMEVRQLDEALQQFAVDQGLAHAPRILLGDLNDVPDVAAFGRPPQATPMYTALVGSGGWEDCSGQSHPPTTFTLNRQYPIDYILLKRPAGSEALRYSVDPPRKVQLVGRDDRGGLHLLPYSQTEGAVFGPPLPPVGTQPAIPSDHVPLTATFWLTPH
eukprot:EG_transcript_6395